MDLSDVNECNRSSSDYTIDTIFMTSPEEQKVASKRVHVNGRFYIQGPKHKFKISFKTYSRSRTIITKKFESTRQTKLWMGSRGRCYELIKNSRLSGYNKLEQIQSLVRSLSDWTHIIKPFAIPQKIIFADLPMPTTYGLLIPATSVPLDNKAQHCLINRTSKRSILSFLFTTLKAVNEYHEAGYLLGGLAAKNIRIQENLTGIKISILKYLNVIPIDNHVSVCISKKIKRTLDENLPPWAECDDYIDMSLEQAMGWDYYCAVSLLNRSLDVYLHSKIRYTEKGEHFKNAANLKNELMRRIFQIKRSSSIEESGLSEFNHDMLASLLEEYGVLI